MEKVISVNLNGNAYQFEEPGYNLLRAYLDRAESQLRENPDKAEVIADLEQAIADKCRERMGTHKTVVSAEDTAQVLNEMGPVDAPEKEGSGGRGAGSAPEPKGSGTPKRLYLIQEGKMIGGVCTGFAAYFNVDVTIVRLIFMALAVVTYGLWASAYIVMMFVIPQAKTPEERAAAFGVPFSAQELIDQAKKNYAGIKNSREMRRQWKKWRRTMRREVQSWQPMAHERMRYPTAALTGAMRPVFGVAIAALFALMAAGIFLLVKTGGIGGWMLPAGIPLWAAIVGIVVLFQILASPLHLPSHAGIVGPQGYVTHSHAYAAWGGIVWLALLGAGLWYGYHHQPQIHALIESLPVAWRDIRDAVKGAHH